MPNYLIEIITVTKAKSYYTVSAASKAEAKRKVEKDDLSIKKLGTVLQSLESKTYISNKDLTE